MSSATVERLEERLTPETIEAAFAIYPPIAVPSSGGISVDFPLLNLGWTFSLSLIPVAEDNTTTRKKKKGDRRRMYHWLPAAFSFTQHNTTICWQNTSICAKLFLGDQPVAQPLTQVDLVLVDTPSTSEVTFTTCCTISSPQKAWLSVTVSNCPFFDGLFGARADLTNEAEVHAQLVRQSGNRVLHQLLSAGRLFDVNFLKFLTPSIRFASGDTGEPLPTYASLPFLEGHIDLSSSVLSESWISALAALDDTGANHNGVPEVSCPKDYEYELDSDFEDAEEGLSLSQELGDECDQAVLEGQQSENGSNTSNSSSSSFEPVEANDQGSVDNQLEELIKDANEPPSNRERTIRIKFAAHRTWQAFLWYCYTGNLEFGKLRSQVKLGGRHLRVTPLEGGPPSCSPKSMYRLADLLGDKDLKAKALVAIKERMTKANVLDESFSVFTSKYPDVRKVQLEVLVIHHKSPQVKESFLRAMELYNSMPHAKPALSAFFDKIVA